MNISFPPRFSASLTIRTEESDPSPRALETQQAFNEHQKDFTARIANIDDKVDPLSIDVEINYLGNATGKISSSENGTRVVDYIRGLYTVPEYYRALVGRAEEKAKTLKPTIASAKNLLSKLRDAFTLGKFKHIESLPGHWSHEVGYHLKSSRAAKIELGGETFILDKSVSQAEENVTYELRAPGKSTPLLTLDPYKLTYQGYTITAREGRDGILVNPEVRLALASNFAKICQTIEDQGVFIS